jgi:general secretion pathway protein H
MAGFTLIELLVVLAVMALLMTAMPVPISAAQSGVKLRTAAQDLTSDLRAAHASALATNGETRLTLNLARHRYGVTPDGRSQELPREAELQFVGPKTEVHGNSVDIRFFPDGTSTGGHIELSLGGRHQRITTHWLTGRTVIDE